jgi:hypothetical protein
MKTDNTALVMFAVIAALGIATIIVVPILQISYAAGVPSCKSVNEHHQPPVCKAKVK